MTFLHLVLDNDIKNDENDYLFLLVAAAALNQDGG